MREQITSVTQHVLYIDDDEDDRDLFAMAMEDIGSGFTFSCVSTAPEALQLIKNNLLSPHMVIVDLNMPKFNGFDFLKALQSIKDRKKPYVIVLTTSALESEKAKAHALGASAFLTKADDYPQFRKSIEDVLTRFLS